MADIVDSDCDTEEFFAAENRSHETLSPGHQKLSNNENVYNSLLRVKKDKSKSLPYPSLTAAFSSSTVTATAESTDDDGLDEKTRSSKKKNKLFRNFSKYGTKEKRKEKLFHKRKPSKSEDSLSSFFGCPLSTVVDKTKLSDGIPIPQVVRDCVDAIERNGLETPNIYFNDVDRSRLEQLKDQYDHYRMKPGALLSHDVNEAATLLKLFMLELPDHVIPPPLLLSTPDLGTVGDDKSVVAAVNKLLNKQNNENRTLFLWLVAHFRNLLSKSEQNGLKVSDVVLLLVKILRLHTGSTQLLTILLTANVGPLSLQNINLKYPEALYDCRTGADLSCGGGAGGVDSGAGGSSHQWAGGARLNTALGVSPPDSPRVLRKDLQLYEELLANLHSKMEDPLADKGVEEELWEVQRVVTSYKRKLRSLKINQPSDDVDSGRSSSSVKTSKDVAGTEPTPQPRSGQVTSTKESQHLDQKQIAEESAHDSECQPTTQAVAPEDVDAWNSCLVASEKEIGVQLQKEILAMRSCIAVLEQERNELIALVANECGASNVTFFTKPVELMSAEEKKTMMEIQEESDKLSRNMVDEVNTLCQRLADLKFLQWKSSQLAL